MGPKRSVHLRDIIIFFLILLFVVGVGYKYLEWSFFNTLSQLQASGITKELSIIEKSGELSQDVITSIEDLSFEQNTIEDRLSIYDELDGKVNLAIDSDKTYLNTLDKNSKNYKTLTFFSRFIVGKRGRLARQIISDQNEYYEKEIESAEESIVGDYLVKNIFSISKDKGIMTLYDNKASASPNTLYSKYFSDIASLEKYTRSDFKFPDEDTIKEKYPYGYETLQNNKDYLASYYMVIKDFVAEDYESASYKYSKLQEQNLKLNVDMDRLLTENQSVSQDRKKRIIELIINKDIAIKEFKNEAMGKYPLLPDIGSWKEDLEMCEIYFAKGGLLTGLSKKPISAKTVDEFLQELAQIGPSTEQIDGKIDKAIIKFTNADDKITYQCTDKDTGTDYIFITSNYLEE